MALLCFTDDFEIIHVVKPKYDLGLTTLTHNRLYNIILITLYKLLERTMSNMHI